MSKIKDDIIISFANSESVNDVTGSSVHVNYKKNNILLDCGLSQGSSVLDNYRKNSVNFTYKVKEIDFVILSHSHIDHSGLIPKLYKNGCTAELLVPKGNKKLLYKMLTNCAMLLNGEAVFLTKRSKNNKTYKPIYEQCDVETTMNYMREIDFYQETQLNDDVKVKFISSAHTSFASSIILEIKKGQNYKKIFYSGDLGNTAYKSYYCNNLDKIGSADIVISECTYSTVEQSSTNKDDREKDKQRLSSVIEQHNKVLIPVFSYHRAQTVATMLYEMYHDKNFDRNIYMDSILLNDINLIYKKSFPEYAKVLEWDKLKLIGKEERKSLQTSNEKMVVLSASGMLTGGASVSWLESMVTNPKNCVVFCGYVSEGTLGYKLKLKKQKTININGKPYKNSINVAKLKSMSSHIQYPQLVEYLSSINTETIVLHHGSKEGKLSFKKNLEVLLSKKCNTARVVIPCKSTKLRI